MGTKVLAFTRYVLGKNDMSLEAYPRQHMDRQEYEAYQRMISGAEPE
jgi:hypothetical protein